MKNRRLIVALLAGATLVGATGAAVATAGVAGADQKPKVDRVVVKGTVGHRLKLTAADLAALPQHTQTVTFLAGTAPQTHVYTGPLLVDVLNAADPTFDPDIKNDKLRHYASVIGPDGYAVTVAWGEIDPGFENKEVLVALTEDGVALGDAGPRVTMPGDSRGGREDRLLPVVAHHHQVGDGDDRQAVAGGETPQLRPAGHLGLVLADDLAEHAGRRETGRQR